MSAFGICVLSSDFGFFGKLRNLTQFHDAAFNHMSNIVISVPLPKLFLSFSLRGSVMEELNVRTMSVF